MECVQPEPAERILRAAVGTVADDRVSHLRQVHADLVLPSRLQRYFKHGEICGDGAAPESG